MRRRCAGSGPERLARITDLRKDPDCRARAVAVAYRMRRQGRPFLRTESRCVRRRGAVPRPRAEAPWCRAAPHCPGRHVAVIPRGSLGADSFCTGRVRSAPVAAVRTNWGDGAATSLPTRGRRRWVSGSSDADPNTGTSSPTALTGSRHAARARSIWTSTPCRGPTLIAIRPSRSDVPRVQRSSAAPCPNRQVPPHSR